MKRITKFMMLGVLFVSLVANSEEGVNNYGDLSIPYELMFKRDNSEIFLTDGDISIFAKNGTDLYTSADGSSSTDNAPRLFFQPKSDFTLSAKVRANFNSSYDGGALFIYADSDNWAKLLFERFKNGDNGIASTVTRSTGDDVYHYLIESDVIHLKIVRKSNTFTFLYSEAGNQWSYLRSFSIVSSKAIKVGFLAQSPFSQTHKAVFSNILFEE